MKQYLRSAKYWTRLKLLKFAFYFERKFTNNVFLEFKCNICGNTVISPVSIISQSESRSCYFCGSTRRFRSIVGILSQELFGKIIPLPNIKKNCISGIGMSDSNIYAKPLSKIFSYINTFYHQEPRLDITLIEKEMLNSVDFVISTECFEHVPTPIGQSFDNLFKILKKDGVCIFSVPYKNEGLTEEYFPELFDYKIVNKKGKMVLLNINKQGESKSFENLRFHGGPGSVLVMRLFSKPSLIENIENVGFVDIKMHDYNIPEFGILYQKNDNAILSMRKPKKEF